jgi:hypothetical protein
LHAFLKAPAAVPGAARLEISATPPYDVDNKILRRFISELSFSGQGFPAVASMAKRLQIFELIRSAFAPRDAVMNVRRRRIAFRFVLAERMTSEKHRAQPAPVYAVSAIGRSAADFFGLLCVIGAFPAG